MAWIRACGGGSSKSKTEYQISALYGGGWLSVKKYENGELTVNQTTRCDDGNFNTSKYDDFNINVTFVNTSSIYGTLYGYKVTSKVPMSANGEKVPSGTISYVDGNHSLILEL